MRVSLILLLLPLLLASPPSQAWNAAGHRLTASIAWHHLSPASRDFVARSLARHPDHPRWLERSGSGQAAEIFAEAATWADNIRVDPRYYDERHEAPTPPIEGLPDHARHKTWHYLDLDRDGQIRAGEIDSRLGKLEHLLRSTADPQQISWALPWLIHLVGDIHQPLHVGRHGDQGGNQVEIEIANRPARPFGNLHQYWDDLPGPASLRGKRLSARARQLMASHPPPPQGDIALWREESHHLLDSAYPETAGSLLPLADTAFQQRAEMLAERRLAEAGWRLARLIERIVEYRVSRGTP